MGKGNRHPTFRIGIDGSRQIVKGTAVFFALLMLLNPVAAATVAGGITSSPSATSASTLTVYAEDRNGNSVSGGTIVLYDGNWNYVDEQATDSDGKVSWGSLDDGTYHLELYVDDEFWGGGKVELSGSETTVIQRVEPYETDTTLTDSNGDGVYEVGETITISPRVYNDAPSSRNVRVKIQVDTDNDGTAEKSVTRGPVTVSSDSDQWYGYDFTPESSGIHQVRVLVETEFGGNWALTDDTGWKKTFDVQSDEGGFVLNVNDRNGYDVSGATVVLYDDNWNYIDERTTDSTGDVSWSGLSSGTYKYEVYNADEFWGGGEADVPSGGTASESFTRTETYERQTKLSDENGDGTYEVGETITISPQIYNDAPYARDVEVTIYVDTDGDGSAEQSVTRGPLTISSSDSRWYGYDFVPETSGMKQVRIEVRTDISGYTVTDTTDWKSFDVASEDGGFTVNINDRNGYDVSGATVVLYDDDWNYVAEGTTDSSGDVSWSGVSPETYKYEVYNGDEFWGGGQADVEASDTTSESFTRSEPYQEQLTVSDENGDGTYEIGETITIAPTIRNEVPESSRSVRVEILIDTDGDGTAELSRTRGPSAISSQSLTELSTDYIPETEGTKQVRVKVYTDIGGDWTVTDDSGWIASFSVGSQRDTLSVVVLDEEENPAADVTVALYRDGELLRTDTTGQDGIASWANKSRGEYRVEVRHNDVYWGSSSFTFDGEPIQFQRTEPYTDQTEAVDIEDGDESFVVDEQMKLTADVRNDGDVTRDVRVTFLVDTNGDGAADETVRTESTAAPAGDKHEFTAEFTPETNGTHRVETRVETQIDGRWVVTSEGDSPLRFDVGSMQRTLSVIIVDQEGTPIEDVSVYLFGPFGDSAETDTQGRAIVGAPREGVYNISITGEGISQTIRKTIRVEGPQTEVRVEAERAEDAYISGQLRTPSGQPAPNVTVILETRDGDHPVTTGSDGGFKFTEPVVAGRTYTLTYVFDGRVLSRSHVTPASGINEYEEEVPEFTTGDTATNGSLEAWQDSDNLSDIVGATKMGVMNVKRSIFSGPDAEKLRRLESGPDNRVNPQAFDKDACQTVYETATDECLRKQTALEVYGSTHRLGMIHGFADGFEDTVEGISSLPAALITLAKYLNPIELVKAIIQTAEFLYQNYGQYSEMVAALPEAVDERQEKANKFPEGTATHYAFKEGWYMGYVTYLAVETAATGGAARATSSSAHAQRIGTKLRGVPEYLNSGGLEKARERISRKADHKRRVDADASDAKRYADPRKHPKYDIIKNTAFRSLTDREQLAFLNLVDKSWLTKSSLTRFIDATGDYGPVLFRALTVRRGDEVDTEVFQMLLRTEQVADTGYNDWDEWYGSLAKAAYLTESSSGRPVHNYVASVYHVARHDDTSEYTELFEDVTDAIDSVDRASANTKVLTTRSWEAQTMLRYASKADVEDVRKDPQFSGTSSNKDVDLEVEYKSGDTTYVESKHTDSYNSIRDRLDEAKAKFDEQDAAMGTATRVVELRVRDADEPIDEIVAEVRRNIPDNPAYDTIELEIVDARDGTTVRTIHTDRTSSPKAVMEMTVDTASSSASTTQQSSPSTVPSIRGEPLVTSESSDSLTSIGNGPIPASSSRLVGVRVLG